MKTLIYDNECPLCAAYTSAFVKTGMLEKEGRKSFDEVPAYIFDVIDKEKCNNEIPLVDTGSGKVWYGIDALLEIIGNKIPLIRSIGKLAPVNWTLKKMYKLISYNRKIIVAVESRALYNCSPAFNIKYQLLFLLAGLFFNSFLWQLYLGFFEKLSGNGIDTGLWIISHYGVVVINITIALFLGWRKGLSYLGQVNMIALTAMLLLLPLYLVNTGIGFVAGIYWFVLGCISLFIVKEYIRRMQYAGIWKHRKIIALNIISVAIAVYLLNC